MRKILFTLSALLTFMYVSSQIAPTSSPYYNNGTYGVAADSSTVSSKKVVIYHPTGGAPGALYPVLIFQPGANGLFGGTITVHSYDLFMKHLCSWGYVVLVIDETAAGLPNGSTFIAVHDWFKTQTTTTGTLLKGCADPTKVAVGGHSNGGVNACALIDARPSEVHGCVLFASYPSNTFPIYHDMSSFTGKVLDLAGADDATSDPADCETGYNAFTAASCKNWALFTGMDHGAFGDYVNSGQPVGSIGRTNATASIRHFLVAFMESSFKNSAVAHASLTLSTLQPNTVSEFNTTCPATVSAEERFLDDPVRIYPVPVIDQLTIGVDQDDLYEFSIFTCDGRLVTRQSIHSGEKEITIAVKALGMKPGFYQMRLRGPKKEYFKKIMVG